MTKPKSKTSMEDTFSKLEALVSRLHDDIPLEESLLAFEEGIKLVRVAQKSLEEAEQKVSLLIDNNGEPLEKPMIDSDAE